MSPLKGYLVFFFAFCAICLQISRMHCLGGSSSFASFLEVDEGVKLTENKTRHAALSRSNADYLVVFNAIGRPNNLLLVEHARQKIFSKDKWDCIAFMYSKEDRISDDNTHLQHLKGELGCSISRTPGLFWGDFLHFVSPTLVSNYDYVSIVLDDVFIPHKGEHSVDALEMLGKMEKYGINVLSPGIINDTFGSVIKAQDQGLDGCVGETDYIETFVQIFTRDAWTCFFKMLHYTGSRGWYYDSKLKDFCPNLTFAYDFSAWAWHMDKTMTELPETEVEGTDLVGWKAQNPITEFGYQNISGDAICPKIGCNVEEMLVRARSKIKREIACPPVKANKLSREEEKVGSNVTMIYYINLVQNTKRRAFMEQWLMKQDIPYKRINAESGNISEHSCIPTKEEPRRCQGIVGLTQTNLGIIDRERHRGLTLLFEDDFKMTKPIDIIVNMTLRIVPDDWDVIRWNCWGPIPSTFSFVDYPRNLPVNAVFRTAHTRQCNLTQERCWFCGGTHAMLWKQSSLGKLRSVWSEEPFDDTDCRLTSEKIKSYCVNTDQVDMPTEIPEEPSNIGFND